MRENINKVSQRGERLDSLQDKTDNLAVSAQGFRRGANRVRKQMWWKDMKMRICLIVGIIILLLIIIIPSGQLRHIPSLFVTALIDITFQLSLRNATNRSSSGSGWILRSVHGLFSRRHLENTDFIGFWLFRNMVTTAIFLGAPVMAPMYDGRLASVSLSRVLCQREFEGLFFRRITFSLPIRFFVDVSQSVHCITSAHTLTQCMR